MRKVLFAVLTLVMAVSVYADLQSVQVGGLIEIRGRWYHNAFETGGPAPQLRLNAMPGRVTGQTGNNVLSLMRYSEWGNDWHFVEQTTSVNVQANFTENVKAFIELYDFETWGAQDFRSNYVTGVDFRANTADDVEVLQAYIEMNEVFGQPLRLRVGRQIMQYGKDLNSFLFASKTSPTQRFSYDGIRATYKPIDKLSIDAWWMKLNEMGAVEEDGDVDFYGVYATYSGLEWLTISPFWAYIRDARKVNDTNLTWFGEQMEDFFGLDDYDVTNFHTVGIQAAGKAGRFDYALNFAYQWGNAGQLGSRFNKVIPFWGLAYGDDDADYDGLWGGDVTVGYTFDTKWNIRPYLQGVYYDGDDNRDVSFWEWLSPFSKPQASISFNRLFSDINYCPVINDNADMTNFWQVGGGVTMTPTEKLWVAVRAYNTWAVEPFDWPAYINVPAIRWWTVPVPSGRLPIAPNWSFWDTEGDTNLGFSLDTIIKYSYSADLTFLLYYGHLWPGDGLRDGVYTASYGTVMNGGLDDQGADYIFWWAILKF